jgi:CBS domain-containing protein
LTLRELIREDLVLVSPSDTVAVLCRQLEAHRVGSALVVNEGTLVGIVTERDVVRAVAQGADAGQSNVSDYMTASPLTIYDDSSMEEAAHEMISNRIRHIPVVDSQNQVLGILSIRDIVRWTVAQTKRDENETLPHLVDLV